MASGNTGAAQGTDMLEITGSNATITVDHNFYTKHGAGYLGDTIVKFVADATGVSTITAFDAAATYRINAVAAMVGSDPIIQPGSEPFFLGVVPGDVLNVIGITGSVGSIQITGMG